MEKFIESLDNAQRTIQTADHMIYVTFPLIKEKRLLLKVLSEIGATIVSTINAVLQYEYYYKRIQIYNTAKDNFETFKRISPRYEISQEQLRRLIEILSLVERHKKSPFEFARNDKIVIMSDGMRTDTISLDKIKSFLIETKELIKKASQKIRAG